MSFSKKIKNLAFLPFWGRFKDKIKGQWYYVLKKRRERNMLEKMGLPNS